MDRLTAMVAAVATRQTLQDGAGRSHRLVGLAQRLPTVTGWTDIVAVADTGVEFLMADGRRIDTTIPHPPGSRGNLCLPVSK